MSRPAAARLTVNLAESVDQGGPLRVDRDRGVIEGVLLLGRRSKNAHGAKGASATVYTDPALQNARPLYEGATAYANHPPRGKPDVERDVNDVVGVYRDVRVVPEGLRADLHYLREKELGRSLADDAERGLGAFKLSHNAQGDGPVKDGVLTIESIHRVRSVDVVSRGATTRSLRESPEPTAVKTTLREYLKAVGQRAEFARALRISNLLEDMGGPAADTPVEAPPPDESMPAAGADPDEALKAGFRAACSAVLDDDSMSAADQIARLKELIQAREKLLSGDKAPAEPEPEAPAEPDDDEGKDKMESEERTEAELRSERKELTRLRREKAVRDLCESLDVAPDKDLVAELAAVPDDAVRRSILKRVKSAAKPRPRSSAPGGARDPDRRSASGLDLAEGYREPADGKEFLSRILN